MNINLAATSRRASSANTDTDAKYIYVLFEDVKASDGAGERKAVRP